MIALEWSDLDFTNNSISITKSTTIANGKPLTKMPKTPSSIRIISIPDSVMAVAKKYHAEQLQYKMALGSQWEGNNYIF